MRRNNVLPRQESLVVPPVQNPFVHRLKLGIWDMIKIAIMSVTIAPLRLILAALCLVSAWPLAALATAFRSPEEAKKPMTGWRKALNGPLQIIGRVMLFVMGFHYVTVKGKPAGKVVAPVLVAAPHSTFFDGGLAFVDAEINSVVSAIENMTIPIFGSLIRFTQPVYVSREDPNSRINTIKEIQQRAQSGGQWPQITIFPEGTCTNRSCLITFKPGAFYPGVPVQPVCLRYPNKLDTYTWTWDGPRAYVSLWLTLCQFHNRMEIEYLPVYYPSEEEKKDAKLYAKNVRAVMAECLKVPITDHTYDDCRLMLRAAKLNMPMAAGLIEFHKLHKKLGLTYDQMQEYLQKFQTLEGSWRGSITIQELGSYLKLPQSDALKELFRLYDRDGSGTIDFREYVIGLSLVSGPANTEETVKFAFQLFDADNKGFIDQTQLTQILNNAFKMQEPDVKALFEDIDKDKDGKISFEEFKSYSEDKPEYAALFTAYHELHQNGHPPVCEDGSGDKAKVD